MCVGVCRNVWTGGNERERERERSDLESAPDNNMVGRFLSSSSADVVDCLCSERISDPLFPTRRPSSKRLRGPHGEREAWFCSTQQRRRDRALVLLAVRPHLGGGVKDENGVERVRRMRGRISVRSERRCVQRRRAKRPSVAPKRPQALPTRSLVWKEAPAAPAWSLFSPPPRFLDS